MNREVGACLDLWVFEIKLAGMVNKEEERKNGL